MRRVKRATNKKITHCLAINYINCYRQFLILKDSRLFSVKIVKTKWKWNNIKDHLQSLSEANFIFFIKEFIDIENISELQRSCQGYFFVICDVNRQLAKQMKLRLRCFVLHILTETSFTSWGWGYCRLTVGVWLVAENQLRFSNVLRS